MAYNYNYYNPISYNQYYNAYPTVHYQQPPSAQNGYNWHGNGYGWQLDPSAWHKPPAPGLYPNLNEAVEEPPIAAEKVQKQESSWESSRLQRSPSEENTGEDLGPPGPPSSRASVGLQPLDLKQPLTSSENFLHWIESKIYANGAGTYSVTDVTDVSTVRSSRCSGQCHCSCGRCMSRRTATKLNIVVQTDIKELSYNGSWNPPSKLCKDTCKAPCSLPDTRFKCKGKSGGKGLGAKLCPKGIQCGKSCTGRCSSPEARYTEKVFVKESRFCHRACKGPCASTDAKAKAKEICDLATKPTPSTKKPSDVSLNVYHMTQTIPLKRPTSHRTTLENPKARRRKPKPRSVLSQKSAHFGGFVSSAGCQCMEGNFIGCFPLFGFGERGSGIRTRGEVQDFYQIRDYHLGTGTLFEDPEFPPNDSSLFYSRRPDRYYEWKRPGEIANNPKLFVEGYSRFDVQQGELGDCWLLAAVANLTMHRRLFFQVVPTDQDFEEKYAGVFHFRFWQYGKWIDVVIDDRLPTYHGQLIFLHSTEDNEFWSALLEKAYAKLHGSYEALKGGSTCEAMEDFTGGVTEMYEMKASPPNLFKIILKAYERSSMMGCSLEPDPNVLEAETPEGLIRGHAYSITQVKYVDIRTPNTYGKIPLLRLRNPWGNETEWNGPWSDKSPEWRYISDEEKEELGLTFDDDGEFWMSYKDFQTHFDRLEICNLTPDSLTEEEIVEGHKKRWEMSVFEGEWVRGVTAGGCRNFLETFWLNPQYRVTVTEADDDDEEGKCTMIVALMQKNRRSKRNMGMDVLTIGFAIYHLPYPESAPKPLDLNFFKYNASIARSPSFINLREVSCRFKLPPGTYCIVPSTFDPNEEGEFLLRVFSEHKNKMEENDEEVSYGDVSQEINKRPLTPEENKATDKVHEFFLQLAGEDLEVDWAELKEIMDYAMKNETPINRAKVENVDATPFGQTENATETLLTQFVQLFCGLVCKNGPLAEIIPLSTTNASQLMNSPHETYQKGFSKDVCRSMVALLDHDRSGKLGFEEFKTLWVDVRNWKNVFRMFDKDNSGHLSGFELRQALNSAGYHLNNHILNIIMHRYGNKECFIEFSDFIMCAVKIKNMIETFKAKDENGKNSVMFTLDEWMEKTLYS